jgi:hypothetical protein
LQKFDVLPAHPLQETIMKSVKSAE